MRAHFVKICHEIHNRGREDSISERWGRCWVSELARKFARKSWTFENTSPSPPLGTPTFTFHVTAVMSFCLSNQKFWLETSVSWHRSLCHMEWHFSEIILHLKWNTLLRAHLLQRHISMMFITIVITVALLCSREEPSKLWRITAKWHTSWGHES